MKLCWWDFKHHKANSGVSGVRKTLLAPLKISIHRKLSVTPNNFLVSPETEKGNLHTTSMRTKTTLPVFKMKCKKMLNISKLATEAKA